jgi:hypothetical protein
VSVTISTRPYEPAPEGFALRFVKDGWRGIERYYGMRNDISPRWVHECGGTRLKTLRERYMRGDVAALGEVPTLLAEIKAEREARLRTIENNQREIT